MFSILIQYSSAGKNVPVKKLRMESVRKLINSPQKNGLIRWHKIRNSKIRNALLSGIVGLRNGSLGNNKHEDPSGRGMPDPNFSIIDSLMIHIFRCTNAPIFNGKSFFFRDLVSCGPQQVSYCTIRCMTNCTVGSLI